MTCISHRCHDLQGLRPRSQGHVVSLSSLGPVSLEAGGGILCRPNPAATLLVNYLLNNARPAARNCYEESDARNWQLEIKFITRRRVFSLKRFPHITTFILPHFCIWNIYILHITLCPTPLHQCHLNNLNYYSIHRKCQKKEAFLSLYFLIYFIKMKKITRPYLCLSSTAHWLSNFNLCLTFEVNFTRDSTLHYFRRFTLTALVETTVITQHIKTLWRSRNAITLSCYKSSTDCTFHNICWVTTAGFNARLHRL